MFVVRGWQACACLQALFVCVFQLSGYGELHPSLLLPFVAPDDKILILIVTLFDNRTYSHMSADSIFLKMDFYSIGMPLAKIIQATVIKAQELLSIFSHSHLHILCRFTEEGLDYDVVDSPRRDDKGMEGSLGFSR